MRSFRSPTRNKREDIGNGPIRKLVSITADTNGGGGILIFANPVQKAPSFFHFRQDWYWQKLAKTKKILLDLQKHWVLFVMLFYTPV